MSYYVKGGPDWSFPDPGHDRIVQAERRMRFGHLGMSDAPTRVDGLLLASVAETLRWLLHTSSTKAAVDKLTQMRKAIKKEAAPVASHEARRSSGGGR
jgi:hypothetical protein